MRYLILLMVLLALVSCDRGQEPVTGTVIDVMMPESSHPEFPEITISSTLEPGEYRMKIDGFVENESRLESVYIQQWGALFVLEVLRIRFNPQLWLRTEDNEMVVLSDEEIVIKITGPPEIVSRTVGGTIHNVIEYQGVAIVNLTRPYIVFETSPPIELDNDDDDADLHLQENGDDDEVISMPEGVETLDDAQRAALLKFGKNDRVVVKNTLDDGLRIRNVPDGTRIGGMFNDETGTIISDPKIADNYVWFEIEWDRPVKDPRSGCGDRDVCVGWSVAVIRDGTEVLDLLR